MLKLTSFTCTLISLALIVLLILSGNEQIQLWWQTYQDYLSAAQYRVENLGNEWSLLFTLMFLFAFKAFIPIYPISLVCAVTGMVFPFYIAIPVNIIGMSLHYTLKYVWGKRIGPGGATLILNRNETVRVLMRKDGTGNPWLLVVFRLIPFLPINPISQYYGSMGFKYWKFVLLSLLGYIPYLFSYTLIGRNVYNPLSAGFLVPLIIVFAVVAIIAYTINALIFYRKKRRRKKNVRYSNNKKQAAQ